MNVGKMIKIIVLIVVILGIFYVVTNFVVNKKTETATNQEVFVQYDEILIGSILNQNREEYYVLITTEKNSYNDLFNNYISTYNEKNDSKKTYISKIDNSFNSKYYSTESDFSNEYPIIKEPTLVKIASKKIVEFYEGNDSILTKLKSM